MFIWSQSFIAERETHCVLRDTLPQTVRDGTNGTNDLFILQFVSAGQDLNSQASDQEAKALTFNDFFTVFFFTPLDVSKQ